MVSIGIVAYRGDHDYATPYAESILKHEPGAQVIMVDSESDPPYEQDNRWQVVRVDYNGAGYNYAKCCNAALDAMVGDWLILSNDDVLCEGQFAHYIEGLKTKYMYGVKLFQNKSMIPGKEMPQVDGWLMLMHRSLYNRVGRFDQGFPQWGVDSEYCYRADDMGYMMRIANIPFVHLESQRRTKTDDWHKAGMEAIKYFKRKHHG